MQQDKKILSKKAYRILKHHGVQKQILLSKFHINENDYLEILNEYYLYVNFTENVHNPTSSFSLNEEGRILIEEYKRLCKNHIKSTISLIVSITAVIVAMIALFK